MIRIPGLHIRSVLICLALICLLPGPVGGGQAPATAEPLRPPASPRRLALLVGVSRYDQTGPHPWPNLQTHEEIAELRRLLISRFRFAERDVVVLEDAAATADGIRTTFRRHLIEQAVPGSIVYFHFSGHGQQLLDDNGDELDGLDESLVPHDTKSRRARIAAQTNIRDDELSIWLAELGKRTSDGAAQRGQILVTLDSCFSGTATRGLLTERGQGWDEALDGPRPRPQSSTARESGVVDTRPAGPLIFLSASQSNQTAKEIDGMGVFSRSLLRALSQSSEDRKLTYQILLEKVSYEVAARVAEQTPGGEGELSQLLFEEGLRPPPAHIAVLGGAGTHIELGIGSIAGATVGSRFKIYKAGTGPLSVQDRLAVATLQAVRETRSSALLDHALDPAVLAGARAVLSHYRHATERLRVRVQGPLLRSALTRRIARLDEVQLLPAAAQGADLSLQLSTRTGRIEIWEAGAAAPLVAPVGTEADAAAWALHLIRQRWCFRHLVQLRAPQLAPAVQLRVVPKEASEPTTAAGIPTDRLPHTVLKEGALFGLELTNSSAQPLYVTVLQLSSDGDITTLLPVQGDQTGLVVPPDGKPHRVERLLWRLAGPPGRLLIKLIATRELLRLSPLLDTRAERAAARPGPSTAPALRALAPILSAGGDSVAERGVDGTHTPDPAAADEAVEPVASWGTAEAVIEVRSAGP